MITQEATWGIKVYFKFNMFTDDLEVSGCNILIVHVLVKLHSRRECDPIVIVLQRAQGSTQILAKSRNEYTRDRRFKG